mmetsp:Transcript_17142/g.41102  ORF Transcript_17142/g.41102 Transcript_17142/m.41102 type:complete len:413 (+) Transcript_17142:274-1512(+)
MRRGRPKRRPTARTPHLRPIRGPPPRIQELQMLRIIPPDAHVLDIRHRDRRTVLSQSIGRRHATGILGSVRHERQWKHRRGESAQVGSHVGIFGTVQGVGCGRSDVPTIRRGSARDGLHAAVQGGAMDGEVRSVPPPGAVVVRDTAAVVGGGISVLAAIRARGAVPGDGGGAALDVEGELFEGVSRVRMVRQVSHRRARRGGVRLRGDLRWRAGLRWRRGRFVGGEEDGYGRELAPVEQYVGNPSAGGLSPEVPEGVPRTAQHIRDGHDTIPVRGAQTFDYTGPDQQQFGGEDTSQPGILEEIGDLAFGEQSFQRGLHQWRSRFPRRDDLPQKDHARLQSRPHGNPPRRRIQAVRHARAAHPIQYELLRNAAVVVGEVDEIAKIVPGRLRLRGERARRALPHDGPHPRVFGG